MSGRRRQSLAVALAALVTATALISGCSQQAAQTDAASDASTSDPEPTPEATTITPPSWHDLSRGKGVMVVKTKADDRSCFYLVQGRNLLVPLHLVKSAGNELASLEALVEFTKSKPPDVILMEAPAGCVSQDDAGELEALSPAERERLGVQ